MVVVVKACKADDVPTGGRKAVTVDGIDLVIFNVGGEYKAVSRWCPHSGGDLFLGTVEQGVVVCPVHDATFSLDDGKFTDIGYTSPLLAKALKDNRAWKAWKEGDDIHVRLD